MHRLCNPKFMGLCLNSQSPSIQLRVSTGYMQGSKLVQRGSSLHTASSHSLVNMLLYEHVPNITFGCGTNFDFGIRNMGYMNVLMIIIIRYQIDFIFRGRYQQVLMV